MPKPRIILKRGNRAAVKREIAQYLVARYAAGATLAFRMVRTRTGKRTSAVYLARATSPDYNEIVWLPENGLTSLLHEIGHHRLEGHGKPKSGIDEIVNEAMAWRWAEWAAQQENLWFDYKIADTSFATYTKAAPIKINWRKKDVF